MNRLNIDSFFKSDIKKPPVVKRGTGVTTGLILKCIGESSCSNGDWIEFVDHFNVNSIKAIMLKSVIENISEKLSLNTSVKIDDCRIFIKSTNR